MTDAGSRRTWIVAHDFSPCADAAADLAIGDLRTLGGDLVLLHVFNFVSPVGVRADRALAIEYRAQEMEAEREAIARLQQVALRLGEIHDTSVNIEIAARFGEPVAVVLEECRSRRVERMYVGTHGKTGVRRLLLGSVAEQIVRRAEVPVVVVHERTPPP